LKTASNIWTVARAAGQSRCKRKAALQRKAERQIRRTPVLPGHFTAFICWTFQAEHTKLKAPTVGAHEYLRTQALGRIYLDNFTNVQSSWVTQGQEIGQVALKFGANDLGSIMIEENVVSQAGTTFRMTVADMHRLIKDLGYEPHQRDNWYRLLNSPGFDIQVHNAPVAVITLRGILW
jgi:2-iminoacetate synthase ThiH